MKNSTTNSGLSKAFRLLADAIAGKEYDYTQGSVRKAVILLAIPMVLEMAMESIFALVDIYFVGKLGADAISVVGITEASITIVYAVVVGISMGVTAIVARRIGEKKPAAASVAAVQVLYIGITIGLIVALIGVFAADTVLMLMGADPQVVEMGTNYTRIMYCGSVTITYLFLVNAIFRGAGHANIAMQSLWLANGINIVLDPCLIFGWWIFPEMGVTGAAVATNIGRGAGVLFLLYHLFGGKARIQLAINQLQVNAVVILQLLKVSAGGVGQFFIATASWVFLMRLVASHGSEAVAGYTIAIRIIMMTFLPAWGISNAAATLVGQNLGANDPDRAEDSVWQTAKYNVIFMVSVAFVLFFGARLLVIGFSDEPIIIDYAIYCLRIIALSYGIFAVGLVLTSAFNGAGDTKTPTWINLICFWILQIPLAYGLANPLSWGPIGVFVAVAVSESLVAVLAWWQFRKGHWKSTVV